MIDLHSHILPGIDDGADNMIQSFELVKRYLAAGFRQVVATPHWVPGTSWMTTSDDIKERVAMLNQRIKDEHMMLEVFPGMEVAFDNELPGLLEKKAILPLADKTYVLLELPFQRLPEKWRQVMQSLLNSGCQILLAHPERCVQLINNLSLFDELIEAGIYMQVNYDSFLEYYGPEVYETAVYLASKGYIHCLATDSHDLRYRHPGNTKTVIEKLVKPLGPNNINLITRINPKHVLTGEPLVSMDARNI